MSGELGFIGDLVIDRARASEVPQIVELLRDDPLGAKREGEPDDPAYADAFTRIDADLNQLLVVVRDEERVVATMQLTLTPGLARRGATRVTIEAIRVAASHRSQGLGSELFAWAIDWARQRGAQLVQLTTDKQRPDAHRLYERLGFAATHVGYKLPL